MRAIGKAGALIMLLAAPVAAEPPEVVMLGDSLTQGYGLAPEEGLVPALQRWLDAQGVEARLINAGVSGDTTAGGRERLEWSLSAETDAVIVELGGNDMLRGLSPQEARANLEAIMQALAKRALPVLLVGTPAPANFGPEYQAGFTALWPELAANYDAVLLENLLAPIMAEPFETREAKGLMQADGLHPAPAGVALVVEQLGPKVIELLARAEAG
ncbi:arylesterase [Thioclava sp. A2]|uniref:arylesterase n=1 Tax=Thioclava sp. FCG-A2 TaxID=3080562 RepID=UPI0029539E2F|nr:arylesterase [Thioclava sp. A2]